MTDLPKPRPLFLEPKASSVHEPDLNLGPCRWLIDADEDEECGKPGFKRVRVANTGLNATVILCFEHTATHNRKFAERRTSR